MAEDGWVTGSQVSSCVAESLPITLLVSMRYVLRDTNLTRSLTLIIPLKTGRAIGR